MPSTEFEQIVLAGADDHDLTKLSEYEKVGGYQSLRKALGMERQAVLDELIAASVRGRGGAGFPSGRKASFVPKPEQTLPRSPGIHDEWLDGIVEGSQPMASFEYSAPFTETMLLGNVALRLGRRLEWDAAAMRVTNDANAEQFLKKEYRRGFELTRP